MSDNAILSALRRMGFPKDEAVIEAQLAHAVRDTLGRAYNRTEFISHAWAQERAERYFRRAQTDRMSSVSGRTAVSTHRLQVLERGFTFKLDWDTSTVKAFFEYHYDDSHAVVVACVAPVALAA